MFLCLEISNQIMKNTFKNSKTSFINGEGASTVAPTCCSRWVKILVVDAQLRFRSRWTSFAHWLFYLSSVLATDPQTYHLQGCFFELARVDLIIICSPFGHSPPGYFCIFFVNFAARESQRLADDLSAHCAHTWTQMANMPAELFLLQIEDL